MVLYILHNSHTTPREDQMMQHPDLEENVNAHAMMLDEYQDLWEIYDIYASLPENGSNIPSSELPTTPPSNEPTSPTKQTESLTPKVEPTSSGESTVVESPAGPVTPRPGFFGKHDRFHSVAFHDKRKSPKVPKQTPETSPHSTHLWDGLKSALPLFRKPSTAKEPETPKESKKPENKIPDDQKKPSATELFKQSLDRDSISSSVYDDDPTSEEPTEELTEEAIVEMAQGPGPQQRSGSVDKSSIQPYQYI